MKVVTFWAVSIGLILAAGPVWATAPAEQWTLPLGPTQGYLGQYDILGNGRLAPAILTWSPESTITFYDPASLAPILSFSPPGDVLGMVMSIEGFWDLDRDGRREMYVSWSSFFLPENVGIVAAYDWVAPATLTTKFKLGGSGANAVSFRGIGDFDADGRLELLVNSSAGLTAYKYPGSAGSAPLGSGFREASLYPNPTHAGTWLEFAQGPQGHVDVSIFDVSGRKVRALDGNLSAAGPTRLFWDGRDDHGQMVPSGSYFWRLASEREGPARRTVTIR